MLGPVFLDLKNLELQKVREKIGIFTRTNKRVSPLFLRHLLISSDDEHEYAWSCNERLGYREDQWLIFHYKPEFSPVRL